MMEFKELSSRTIEFDFSEKQVKHKFITQLPMGVFEWLKMKSSDTGKPMTKVIYDALMQVRNQDFIDSERDRLEREERKRIERDLTSKRER